MNWAKGAFRVWIVSTVMWLGYTTWDIYSDSGVRIAETTNHIEKLERSDRNLEITVTLQRDGPWTKYSGATKEDHKNICLLVDWNPLGVGITEGKGRFLPLYCNLPDLLLRQIDLKKFDPDAYLANQGQMYGLDTKDAKLYLIQKLSESRSKNITEASWRFGLFGLLPPICLAAIWFIFLWIVRGFKAESK